MVWMLLVSPVAEDHYFSLYVLPAAYALAASMGAEPIDAPLGLCGADGRGPAEPRSGARPRDGALKSMARILGRAAAAFPAAVSGALRADAPDTNLCCSAESYRRKSAPATVARDDARLSPMQSSAAFVSQIDFESPACGGFSEKLLLTSRQILARDIFHVCGDAPLLSKGISKLAVTIAPEHVLYRHVYAGSRVCSPVENRVRIRNVQVQIHRIAGAWRRSGDRWPMESFTKIIESPIFNSACMTLPSGPGKRSISVAPKAFL